MRSGTLVLLFVPAIGSAQWNGLATQTNDDLVSVQYRADGNVWIGATNAVHYSLDHGITFVEKAALDQFSQPIGGPLRALHAFDANTAVVTGDLFQGIAEYIWRTDDAGTSYDLAYTHNGPFSYRLNALEFAQAPIGLAVGLNGHIRRTTDNGQNWNGIASPTVDELHSLVHVAGNTYLGGTEDEVIRSTTQGASWSTLAGSPPAPHLCAHSGIAYAASAAGVWRTLDLGTTWTLMSIPPGDPNDVVALDANTLILATDQGLYRSTSGGQYWEQFPITGYQPVRRISFYDAQHGIAVGNDGYAIHTGNGGGPTVPIAAITAPTGTSCLSDTITFISSNDPAYTFSWSVNGVPQPNTTPTLSVLFGTAGNQVVQLVVDNGFTTDTTEVTVSVLTSPQVPPFTVTADPDTICAGAQVTMTVPITTVGTWYRQVRDGVPTGSTYPGNGLPRTFNAFNVQNGTSLAIMAGTSNACGADTLVLQPYLAQLTNSPGTTYALSVDSICVPGTSTVVAQNTLPGFSYRYTSTTLSTSSWVPATGGSTTIPLPTISSANQAFHALQFQAAYGGRTCTALAGPDTLHVFGQSLFSDLMDTTLVTGAPVQFQVISSDFDHILWEFGPSATPATHVGPVTPPVSWSQAGFHTITLTGSHGTICQRADSAVIEVREPPPLITLPSCGSGSVDGDLYISDMYLDGYNNRYLTGQFHGGVSHFNHQLFVMKVDSLGELVWSYFNPPSSTTFGLAITADHQGNAYVTVEGHPSWLQFNEVAAGHRHALFKFGLNGEPEWVVSSLNMRFRGITCTPDNTIHAIGVDTWEGAQVQLADGQQLTLPDAATDPGAGSMAILRLAPDGSLLGWEGFGRANHPDSLSAGPSVFGGDVEGPPINPYRIDPMLEALPNGDLFVYGLKNSQPAPWQVDFDGTVLVDHAGTDTTVNKTQIYGARYVPGTGFTDGFIAAGGDIRQLQRMEQAGDGSYRVCGWARDAWVANGSITDLGGPSDPEQGFLARLAADGSVTWEVHENGFHPFDLHVDASGSTQVLGAVAGFGRMTDTQGQLVALSAQGSSDRVIMTYTSAGLLQDVDLLSLPEGEVGYRMRPDACDNLHVATVTGLSGNFMYQNPLPCVGCMNNVRFDVIGLGGCGGNCAAAYDPAFRDVALVDLRLSTDTTGSVGPRDLIVDLLGVGGVPITSLELAYRVNGGPVQTHTWTGTLDHGEHLLDLAIGNEALNNEHYARITCWVQAVNGVPDMDALNDTLHLEQLICNSPLSGTYSLGDGEYFHAFHEAAAALSTCGISATTVIEVQDGTYYDQFIIGSVAGVSPTDSVVVRSASGDTASVALRLKRRYFNSYETVGIRAGASRITLQDLSVYDPNPAFINPRLVRLEQCGRVNILGCHLELNNGLGWVLDLDHEDFQQSRILIEGNTFRFGRTGISGGYSPGVQVDSLITIRGNFFDRQHDHGVAWTGGQVGLQIEGNRFFTEPPFASDDYIAVLSSFGQRGGIKVLGNSIHAIMQGTSPYGLITLWTALGSVGRTQVINNMVVVENASDIMALYISPADGRADIAHNTFTGTIRIWNDSLPDMAVRNNIIHSPGLAIQLIASDPSGLDLDHNLYWSSDTSAGWEWFRLNNTWHALADWQNQFGWDLNSELGEAQFISPTDLHLDAGNWFSCPTLPYVTTDIDGDLRGPVITRQGADEGSGSVALPPTEATGILELWPNPTTGTITVQLDKPYTDVEILVQNALGQTVQRQDFGTAGSVNLVLAQPPGVYVVHLRSAGSAVASVKVVKE